MNKGINTATERKQIEYRPHLEYIPPTVYIEEESGERKTYQVPEQITKSSEIKITDSFRAIDDLFNKLNQIIENLEDKLKNDSVRVDEKNSPEIYQALQEINIDSNQITFAKYKEIKLKPNRTSFENIVKEHYEEEHMRLEGKLEVAMLSIAYDMIEEIRKTRDFVISKLLNQDSNFDIEEAETNEIEKLNKWLEHNIRKQQLEEEYHELTRAGEDLNSWRKEYREVNKKLKELAPYSPKNEIGRSIYDRAQRMNKVLDKWEDLSNNTLADEFDGYIFCLIKNIVVPDVDLSDVINRLKSFQSLIEFAHGDRINSIKSIREQIRNLDSLAGRTTLQMGAAAIGALKNHAGGIITNFIRKSSEGSECPAFLELGNEMMEITQALEVQYQDMVDDYYKANKMESAYHLEHVNHLGRKKKNQGIFKIINQLIKELENIDEWTQEKNIDDWIVNFIKANNLNVKYNPDTQQVEEFSLNEYT